MSGLTASAPAVAWPDERVDDRLVVGFRPGVARGERDRIHESRGARVERTIPQLGVEVVRLPRGADEDREADGYRRASAVAFAEPDRLAEPLAEPAGIHPDDPSLSRQWGIHNDRDSDVDAPQAWARATGSPDVGVAVIDTGMNTSHRDLAPNVRASLRQASCPSRIDCRHATHVAGIAGARGNNGEGVAGINWTVGLIDVEFDFTESGAAEAIAMVADYARSERIPVVANASFGGRGGCPSAVKSALDYAAARDVLFVAAAGNDSSDNDSRSFWPAVCPNANVIAVAATTKRDGLASFSNYGQRTVHLGAPGAKVYSTYGSSYAALSGTSMAAPMVAGAAALLRAAARTLTWAEIKGLLIQTVDPLAALAGRTVSGGRLNVARALQCATPEQEPLLDTGCDGSVTDDGSTAGWTRAEDGTASYEGRWRSRSSSGASGGSYHKSGSAGSTATFAFTGTAVRWVGASHPKGGIADVLIDGVRVATVDTYGPKDWQAVLFEQQGLTDGPHTLQVSVTGTRSTSSSGTVVVVDAVDVA